VYGTVQHSTVLYSTHIIEIQKLTTDNTTKAGINYKELKLTSYTTNTSIFKPL